MIVKIFKLLTGIVVVTACLILPVSAMQLSFDQYAKIEQQVLIDYATFASDDSGLIRAEIYYQVYNDALPFHKVDGGYKADYEVSLQIIGKKDKQAGSYKKEKTVRAANEKEADSHSNYRINQANFDLPPGKYKLIFLLSDKHSQAIIRRELKLKLNSYHRKKPQVSDIELVQATGQATDESDHFAKSNMIIIPSLTKRFSSEDSGRFLYYFEIYRGTDQREKVTVETTLRHNRRGMIYRDTLDVLLDKPVIRQLRDISLSDFMPGKYELYIRLRGRRFKKIAEKKTEFEIAWSQSAAMNISYKTTLDQLEYIAEPGVIKPLRKITDPKERVRALNAFWKKHDPNPATKLNELKVVFYHRIDVANRLFTIMFYEGWRSDRGRIYIQYGEPDQIDDYPFSSNQYPYQQWHYYEHGRYRKFTFIDKNGDGDYRLLYPYDGLNQRPDF